MTDNDRIGYLADYPIYGMTASINAFAQGVRMVNPRAKIYLKWSTVPEGDTDEIFRQMGVSHVSGQDLISAKHGSRQFGLYDIRGGQIMNVASPVWNWGEFYERMIRSILTGAWKKEEPAKRRKAINYWWGISSGMIDVIYSKNVPSGAKQLAELLKQQIRLGVFNPFSGVIYDQEGRLRNQEPDTLSPEQIITMDWLTDNVVGAIPEEDELIESARPIVRLQGVKQKEKVPVRKA